MVTQVIAGGRGAVATVPCSVVSVIPPLPRPELVADVWAVQRLTLPEHRNAIAAAKMQADGVRDLLDFAAAEGSTHL
jgi:hypothetical protein